MIKVSFYSNNTIDDVCEVLERDIAYHNSIETWICDKVPGIYYDCMDFPYDLPAFYDVYFVGRNETSDSLKVYNVLEQELKYKENISFQVSIVDDKFVFIKEINEEFVESV